ncbi:hypothetical protein [Methylobacterium sp. WL6]|uniref:hypothetical protein n=1 Tax=Methylobacterium sp. WL6 TaxID=2603901 RepID=UPI0011CBEAAD|nr:hypothetical protein [Methylobacterium sp. WL6]TXN73695.1 hypothetical protein FV230_00205 [Methylobacterium sp. WL6]
MIHTAKVVILPMLGAAVVATIGSYSSVKAQSGSVSMTLPTCEAYQRERPRGGPWEQLSGLFGLSIYRWTETDYGRYRTFLLDCKRSLPGFREDTTARDWEGTTEKSVAGLKSYTGFLNQLREPMANRYGPGPRTDEPDHTLVLQTLSCDRFNRQTVNAWPRGGAPDYGPDAPFSVPLAGWTYEVWRAFENRVKNCVQLPAPEAETERDWLHTLVFGQEVQNEAGIRQAQQDAIGAKAKLAGILARATEADGLTAADDITLKLKAVEALEASGPKLGRAEAEQVTAAKDRILAKLRAARAGEAEAWERDRPAREARARTQEQDAADLQRRNRNREVEAAGERERTARIEADRQAEVRAQAERQAAEADKQRQRDDAKRVAEQQVKEKADAEFLARNQREEEAALAVDPCNKVAVRRQMMDAANAIDLSQFRGQKLLDLTRGRTLPAEPNVTRSCLFIADWSSGQRGLVTITVRKNSFGDNLIEVRPF